MSNVWSGTKRLKRNAGRRGVAPRSRCARRPDRTPVRKDIPASRSRAGARGNVSPRRRRQTSRYRGVTTGTGAAERAESHQPGEVAGRRGRGRHRGAPTATSTATLRDGQVTVFVAVDDCTSELVGIHASRRATRFKVLEPILQSVRSRFGGVREAAAGLAIRYDHGSQYMSRDFQNEIAFLGTESSPSLVRGPEGNCIADALHPNHQGASPRGPRLRLRRRPPPRPARMARPQQPGMARSSPRPGPSQVRFDALAEAARLPLLQCPRITGQYSLLRNRRQKIGLSSPTVRQSTAWEAWRGALPGQSEDPVATAVTKPRTSTRRS